MVRPRQISENKNIPGLDQLITKTLKIYIYHSFQCTKITIVFHLSISRLDINTQTATKPKI